jgi:hypothetical protein
MESFIPPSLVSRLILHSTIYMSWFHEFIFLLSSFIFHLLNLQQLFSQSHLLILPFILETTWIFIMALLNFL